ncbi:chemotaxis protein methyltransferase CheR [Povalibacter uvarum]|uniref:Chemotaxis protein methyltransferase CheR n=1 Tax=Povalibacter uvarum TaxID=732238 RepID=A0A841HR44_9GAMM|nr:protein-glutamate O-methyltransferase CheR [Povalibacter uvarum]MBB6095233.1 chemotaxis protein methyltransferase CheR [Povalibacter uvarum]
MRPEVTDLEIRLLLEAIYERFHYDFRQYAIASIRRRLIQALTAMHCESISALQARILHDERAFPRLLAYLTIQVTDLFRDPEFFLALRQHVVPILATYPSLKLWIAGCSTGEEAYSFAILLAEEGLLDRTLIYATDINDDSLRKAQTGVYALDRLRQFILNYRAAGGTGSLSDYYHADQDNAVMAPELRRRITFADHSLATDSIFSEVQLVSCRNVLIYFDRELQDRALGLFADALCPRGFLCLGTKESIRFSAQAPRFNPMSVGPKIFRRVD